MSEYENESPGEVNEPLGQPEQPNDVSQADKSSQPEMLESNPEESSGRPIEGSKEEDLKQPEGETAKQKISEGFELAPDQNGIF